MIESMKSRDMHAQFISVLSGVLVTLALLAFVDDTELFLTDVHDDPNALITRANEAIKLWRELLYVTGGVMRSNKCAWTLITFNNTGSNAKIQNMDTYPGDIFLLDENGTMEKVYRYDQHHPREYLGIRQTVTGKDNAQLQTMQEAIVKWNKNINLSRLPPILNHKAVL